MWRKVGGKREVLVSMSVCFKKLVGVEKAAT
jgi:hypothetical protein